jgi:hypothetical protein
MRYSEVKFVSLTPEQREKRKREAARVASVLGLLWRKRIKYHLESGEWLTGSDFLRVMAGEALHRMALDEMTKPPGRDVYGRMRQESLSFSEALSVVSAENPTLSEIYLAEILQVKRG